MKEVIAKLGGPAQPIDAAPEEGESAEQSEKPMVAKELTKEPEANGSAEKTVNGVHDDEKKADVNGGVANPAPAVTA